MNYNTYLAEDRQTLSVHIKPTTLLVTKGNRNYTLTEGDSVYVTSSEMVFTIYSINTIEYIATVIWYHDGEFRKKDLPLFLLYPIA